MGSALQEWSLVPACSGSKHPNISPAQVGTDTKVFLCLLFTFLNPASPPIFPLSSNEEKPTHDWRTDSSSWVQKSPPCPMLGPPDPQLTIQAYLFKPNFKPPVKTKGKYNDNTAPAQYHYWLQHTVTSVTWTLQPAKRETIMMCTTLKTRDITHL